MTTNLLRIIAFPFTLIGGVFTFFAIAFLVFGSAVRIGPDKTLEKLESICEMLKMKAKTE